MIVTKSQLRRLIYKRTTLKEEAAQIDHERMNDLLKKVKADVIDYIDNPSSGGGTFKIRLNKKLKELNFKELSNDEVQTIKNIIKSLNLKILDPFTEWPPDVGNAVAFYKRDVSLGFIVGFNSLDALKKGEQNAERIRSVKNSLYHEVYHALDSALDSINRYSNLSGQPLKKIGKGRYKDISDMFKDEFNMIIDKRALTDEKYWRQKVKQSGIDFARWGGMTPEEYKKFMTIMSDQGHFYTSLQQLRNVFSSNTIRAACNANKQQLKALGFYESLLITLLRCTPAAESAAEKIAKRESHPSDTALAEQHVIVSEDVIRRMIREELIKEEADIDVDRDDEQSDVAPEIQAGHHTPVSSFGGKGKNKPFSIELYIDPMTWTERARSDWDRMTPDMQKFLAALPAAVAATGYAKDRADALIQAAAIVGRIYDDNRGQAQAVYNGPYRHDLLLRQPPNNCQAGSYFFAGKPACKSSGTSGVYARGGVYEKIFNAFEELTGGKLQNRRSARSQAIERAVALLDQSGYKGGHAKGANIDIQFGNVGQRAAKEIVRRASEITGIKALPSPEIDHWHTSIGMPTSGIKAAAKRLK